MPLLRFFFGILFYIIPIFVCSSKCLIGAYYFDGWSGQNSDQELNIINAPTHLTSDLLYHYGTRKPIWGWRDDDIVIMEKQIDLASSNGIDFFSFCWYWQDNKSSFSQINSESLSINNAIELFMKAKNKHKMKFCILVANHKGYEIIGEENHLQLMEYFSSHFFSDPQYLKIDNKPVVSFFNSSIVLPFINIMDKKLIEKGWNGLFSMSCNNMNSSFSSHSWYNIIKPIGEKVQFSYFELIEHVKNTWYKWKDYPEVAPLVMSGWDRRPWDKTNKSSYFINRKPSLFKKHLQDAIDFILAKKTKNPIIMIYAWNEYGEGGYLAPTIGDPRGSYLKMIKQVRKKNRM